ncbi:putative transporter [Photobacterium phosphoreum]|jgi:putative transport protein|uniref:Putative transport protein GLP33_00295 n=1 Tax=Photobacterium phosphoreum TaxID=659 RepID=A0AAW4ZLX5_PHOPO|nr:putative transporter [Photobacterium phosphoreum]KJF86684.1 transporter [Photobacterium phosphoreum]MCD9461490.1 transporter [Photobacterium phosphoreum]MCD9480308.1 putative transporter [Photobacterium phosphoreum]MCD9483144.1 putative transporter [Photobacterium phosphoreum]MCD9489755.1 putative transporter [Photobacterium phosphoreum]
MSDIALSISILSLVAVLGLWMGSWKIKGVGLGIGGVLFGGIIVGHYTEAMGITLNAHTLHFIQEFGLILFVYTIGIQVGPGFFASLRSSGLKLNGFAALVVFLGCVVAVLLYIIFDVPLPILLGIYSGAVTNTPALGAGQQILSELGVSADLLDITGMGYAVAYPFGICGILISMWLLRLIFKVNIDQEAIVYNSNSGDKKEGLQTLNIAVRNPNLNGLTFVQIPAITEGAIICSRLKRGNQLSIPKESTPIELNDVLHLVGTKAALEKARLVIGDIVDISLSTKGTDLQVERLVVTNEIVLGKKIRELELKEKYDVVISRLNRAGVELIPNSHTSLQFGDILNLVGSKDAIAAVSGMVGNAEQKLQHVQMLPIFIGIGLGILLGSIPLYLPGFPAALKLGLAGGPLIVALILARIGSIGKLYWFMPPSANLALREIGIVLFLAVVGLKSGNGFIDTLVNGDGFSWMAYGALITFIPLIITGCIARIFGELNYLSMCGMLAGSMTDPPALAFANGLHPTNGAAALSYATVYPLVMCLRILSPQILAILLWIG